MSIEDYMNEQLKMKSINNLNGYYKDNKNVTYYVNTYEENGVISISSSYFTNNVRGKYMTLYTEFYVWHGYYDYVGKVHSSATYYKHYTATGQPYYTWSNPAGGKYDYREDGFTVYNNHYSKHNTSRYKKSSYIKETLTWDTNISYTNANTNYFYAPANK